MGSNNPNEGTQPALDGTFYSNIYSNLALECSCC